MDDPNVFKKIPLPTFTIPSRPSEGVANSIVLNPKDLAKIEACDSSDNGISGILKGIRVYKDESLEEGKIIMGYKGKEILSAGMVYAPYVPLYNTPGIPNRLEEQVLREAGITMIGDCDE